MGAVRRGSIGMTPWKDICECDVEDKEHLALFREKLSRWKECATGGDVHSVQNQIANLLWDDTVFRTFNEARRLSEETADPSTGLPGTMIELLDKNFMDSQVMAIRRLTDSQYRDPRRVVVSLPTLVAEVKEAVHLYSRENYVCYDGIPYAEAATDDERVRAMVSGRHHDYDRLAGCSSDGRSRHDRVKPTIFNDFAQEQAEFEILKAYANKYLAHAADPANRGRAQEVLDEISLCRFHKCYRALFRIVSVFGLLIDERILCEVPGPPSQGDQLRNWDRPIITGADRDKLYQYWRDREYEIDRWSEEARSNDTQSA